MVFKEALATLSYRFGYKDSLQLLWEYLYGYADDRRNPCGMFSWGFRSPFNASHPLSEWAAAAGTIPYEVLAGLGQRVSRVWR